MIICEILKLFTVRNCSSHWVNISYRREWQFCLLWCCWFEKLRMRWNEFGNSKYDRINLISSKRSHESSDVGQKFFRRVKNILVSFFCFFFSFMFRCKNINENWIFDSISIAQHVSNIFETKFRLSWLNFHPQINE